LSRAKINESQFADDLALYALDRGVFESAGRKFVEVGSQFGLTVSIPKTKGLYSNEYSRWFSCGCWNRDD